MEQQLYELLHQCTVRISVTGKTGYGTGFFVAPGLIMTCAHVIQAAQSNNISVEVYWNHQLHSAQIMVSLHDPDLALLQANLTDHPCAYLHEEAIPFDNLYSYGYPDDHPNGDPATFSLEGKAGEQGEQLKFKTGQVRPGMSGAPLLNVRTGYVCGIVQLTRDRNNDLGGRAIPLSTVLQFFPELVAQQQQFHQNDKRWTNCLWEVVARTRYLEGMIRRYSSVTLPLGPASGFSLQAIFQPLKLRSEPLTAEDLAHEERRALLGEPRYSDQDPRRVFLESQGSHDKTQHVSHIMIAENAEEALKMSTKRSMVILGSPGTGKTTLLKYLVSHRAKKALSDPTALVPLFIFLPDLARSGKTLKEYLVSVVQDMMVDERYALVLWKALEQGQAFVCLDSLDEVDPKLRPEKIRLINEWALSTSSTYIVGSRFTDYKGGQLRHGQFTEWELLPLSPALREELAKRLLPELYRFIPSEQKATKDEVSVFISVLEKHEQAAAWGENPLLFSLAAAVFVRTGTLPFRRVELYQRVIDSVLETREPDQTPRELLRCILTCLALELFQEKGRTFTRHDLLRFLQLVRKKQDEQWDTEEIARRIIDSGVLEIVAHDTYGFRHQTFQEYLAAVELAQRLMSREPATREDAWNLAWNKRTYSRWTEVLRLIVGVLAQSPEKSGRAKAGSWLRELLKQRSTGEGDPGDLDLVLTLKSLVEVTRISEGGLLESANLEKNIISHWIDGLIEAAHREQQARIERLKFLVRDLVHLQAQSVESAMGQLVKALNNRDEDVRNTVSEVLEELGDHMPKEVWLPFLHHPNSSMRQIAVRVVRKWEDAPIETLVEMLSYETIAVCAEVIEALEGHQERVPLEPLLTILRERNWSIEELVMPALIRPRWESISVEALLAALRHLHKDVRQMAVDALRARRKEVLVAPLLELLQDTSSEVRQAAIKVLEVLGEQVPLDPLLAALEDEDREVRRMAIDALGEQGERTPLDPLLAMLRDEDAYIRQDAIYALGKQGERVPIEPLLAMLQDEDRDVRWAVLYVLGEQGERVPPEPLLAMLQDKESSVRREVVDTLGTLGEGVPLAPLLNMLEDEVEYVRDGVVEVLGKQKERVPLAPLLQALKNKKKGRGVRQAAVEVLGALGERVPLEPLLAALQDNSWEVRRAAVKVLGKQRERVPLDPLLAALEDTNESVRREAVEALGAQGERVPLEPLLTTLQDESWDVRQAAVKVLKTQGERVPLDPLLALLQDKNWDAPSEAMDILEAHGERVSTDLWLQAIWNTNEAVHRAAARVLERRKIQVPIEPLFAALEDKDWKLHRIAIEMLETQKEQVSAERLLPLLRHPDWHVREGATKILKALGVQMPMELLLFALEHPDDKVRETAVAGMYEGLVPVELLLLALRASNSGVRQAAIQMVRAHEEQVPAEALLTALEYPHAKTRQAAVEVLGAQSEGIPIQLLLKSLEDGDSGVRQAAVIALRAQGERVPIEPLLAAFKGKGSGVRQASMIVLEALGERVPVEIVLEALEDEDMSVRRAALPILRALGKRVPIESLWALLEHEDWEVQDTIEEILKMQGERVPVEPLLAYLSHQDWKVRGAATEVLEVLGKRVPLEPLLAALQESGEEVRWAAVRILNAQGERVPLEPLLEALRDEHEEVREAVIVVLAEQRERLSIPRLQEVLQDADEDLRDATTQLLKTEQEWIEEIVAGLKSWDGYERLRALQTIRRLSTERMHILVEPLVAALRDTAKPDLNNQTEGQVREEATKILKAQGEAVPMELLLELLKVDGRDGQDPEKVHWAAIEILKVQEERVPPEPLLEVLSWWHWEWDRLALQEVIEILRRQKERAPLEPLLTALRDRDPEIRRAAIQILEVQGERVPIALFLKAVHDADEGVRSAAVHALGIRGEQVLVESLLGALGDKSLWVRRTALEVLGTLAVQVPSEPLLLALYDGDSDVRRAAIEAIGKRGGSVPVEPLVESLGDQNDDVRHATIQMLKIIAPEAFSPVVAEAIEILQAKQLSGHVLASLAQIDIVEMICELGIPSTALVGKLCKLLDWPFWQVRLAAVQGLGRLRRSIPDTAIRRLLDLRLDTDPKMRLIRNAADDALLEILSLETGIEDD